MKCSGEGPRPALRDGQRLRDGRAALPGGRGGAGLPAVGRPTGCGSSCGGTRGRSSRRCFVVGAFGGNRRHDLGDAARAAAETEASSRAESEKTARQEADKASKEAVANMVTALQAIDLMLTRVAEKLADTPQMEQVRQGLLEDALWFYHGLLGQKSTDPGLRLEMGKALTRVGFIYYYMDQRTDATRTLRESVAVLEALVAEYPSEPSYRAALVEGCIDCGRQQSSPKRRPQEAEALLRRALDLVDGGQPEDGGRCAILQASRRPVVFRALRCEPRGRPGEAWPLRNNSPGGSRPTRSTTRPKPRTLERLGASSPEPTWPKPRGFFVEPGHSQEVADRSPSPSRRPRHRGSPGIKQGWPGCFRRMAGWARRKNSTGNPSWPVRSSSPTFRLDSTTDRALGLWHLQQGSLLETTNRSVEAEKTYRQAWAVSTENLAAKVEPQGIWFDRLIRIEGRLVGLLGRRRPKAGCRGPLPPGIALVGETGRTLLRPVPLPSESMRMRTSRLLADSSWPTTVLTRPTTFCGKPPSVLRRWSGRRGPSSSPPMTRRGGTWTDWPIAMPHSAGTRRPFESANSS